MLGRALLLFLGSTLHVTSLLAAGRRFPNKDSFQGQASGRRGCGYNRVQCTLRRKIAVVSCSVSRKIQQGHRRARDAQLRDERDRTSKND